MAEHTFVIAEAGVNHNGSLARALELVDVAADAQADAVKFQTFKAHKLATAQAAKADYQVANMQEAGNQLDMLAKLELSLSDHAALVQRCKARGIHFMSTAFDAESLAHLATLGMPALKIPSGDINCGPLLLQAARLGMPLIVSTGMCTLADIEDALGVIAFGLTQDGEPRDRSALTAAFCSAAGQAALRRQVSLLHCVTQYPAPPDAVNLRAMDTMAQAFGLPVGYSDHTLGIEVALAAVARGATIIEKHFTLDQRLPGPDHAASLEPEQLHALVRGIRTIEQALGGSLKMPAAAEMPNRPVARRSIVAAHRIRQGEVFTAASFEMKRPGTGLSPLDAWGLVGQRASRDFETDELITR
jgi:N-acetylneuraminate synthase